MEPIMDRTPRGHVTSLTSERSKRKYADGHDKQEEGHRFAVALRYTLSVIGLFRQSDQVGREFLACLATFLA
jgi:hypothetical protein